MRGLCFKLNPSRLAQRAQEIERRISASIIRKKRERKDASITSQRFIFFFRQKVGRSLLDDQWCEIVVFLRI